MSSLRLMLSEAERCLMAKGLDAAAELYKRAYTLDDGRSPLPVVGIARVALLLGRQSEAAALLDQVLATHPGSAEALTIRGAAAEAAGDVDGALSWHQRAVAAGPAFGPALLNLGRCLAQKQRWPEATQLLADAARALDGRSDVLCLLGTAAFRAGDTRRAIEVLSLAVQKDAGCLDAIATLADVLVEAGQNGLAERLLENAQARLASPMLPAKRAAIAMREGRAADARRHVEEQLARDPDDEEARLLLAVLATAQLDLTAAEHALQEVLRRNPNSWRAYHHLGGIYESLRLRAAALAAYRRAAELEPTAWEPRNNLATLLLEGKTADTAREARRLLEACLPHAPADKQAMVSYNLALAAWQLGDRKASEARARQAVQQSPASSPLAATARRFLDEFGAAQGARR